MANRYQEIAERLQEAGADLHSTIIAAILREELQPLIEATQWALHRFSGTRWDEHLKVWECTTCHRGGVGPMEIRHHEDCGYAKSTAELAKWEGK